MDVRKENAAADSRRGPIDPRGHDREILYSHGAVRGGAPEASAIQYGENSQWSV
jgi:hypothetical protein